MDKFNLWIREVILRIKKPLIYIILGIIVLLFTFLAGKCSTKKERLVSDNNLIVSRDSVKQYLIKIDGLKYSVSKRDAIIITKNEAIDAGFVREDVLKKLHIKDLIANANLEGKIKIQDSLFSLPHNPIYITVPDISGIKYDYLRLPFDLLDIHTKYLTLIAGMDILRKGWYKLSIPITGNLIVGTERTGLFKTKPVGIFTTDNEYLTFNKMDVVITNNQKKDRWGLGIIGGYGFNIFGTIKGGTFIGVGGSYNFITF